MEYKLLMIDKGSVKEESRVIECSVEQVKNISSFINRVLRLSNSTAFVDYELIMK